jgi:hypothetical protein
MIKRTYFLIFLLFCWLIANGNASAAGQSDRTSTSNTATIDGPSANDVQTNSSIAPPFLTPGKDLFVTREGDPFVITVTSTCLLEDESESQFELLSPTPDFIHVSESYRREVRANGYAEGIGVVYVTPQTGDAGKYLVTLQVKACNGRVERVISFRVHVKAAI